jgi:hypothetical protein
MIVVEAGHAHVMKFCRFHVNCQFLSLSLSFLGEKCGDKSFIFEVKLFMGGS